MVLESNLEISKVIKIPSKTTHKTTKVETKEEAKLLAKKLPIKIVAIVIKKGNLPLQGTKLFVKIAINFSLGESIILVPTTPSSITAKSHAHGNDKMVVLESVDKCGVMRFTNVKVGVYFRL